MLIAELQELEVEEEERENDLNRIERKEVGGGGRLITCVYTCRYSF